MASEGVTTGGGVSARVTATDRDASWANDGHVIVCGLRGVGLRTVEQLHQSRVPVVVVDDAPDPRLAAVVEAWGVTLIRRSARIGDGLAGAGLDRAQAVICVESDELATLEIAMRVREARPDVRLVVLMANPSVGRALERVLGAGTILDPAALAAPSFVEVCLHRASHRLELGGERFVVAEVTVGEDGSTGRTFRSHFGHLAPVAVVPAGDGEIACCPGRDHPVGVGDRVTVLATDAELHRAGIDLDDGAGPAGASIPPAERARRRLVALRQSNGWGLAVVAAGVLVLLVVASSVIRVGYVVHGPPGHLSALESVYFTVETVATVGYGDLNFAGQADWFVIFGIVLILLGVGLVSTAFALFTNFLVSRRIDQSLGRGKVPGMTGHVVVVGLGAVGVRVVEGLVAEGRRVVVVERDAGNRYLDRARALQVPVVIADATQRQTHAAVNLADASAVAILTSADLTNIETGLAVRESLGDRWDVVPVVLRVFDRDLARMMERNFGFRHVRSTSALAAPWFVGAALGLDVLETFFVDQQPFLVGRLTIARGGGLQGLAMQDLSARTRVVALARAATGGAPEHPPRRGTRFQGGDQAYLLGPYDELLDVLRRDQRPAGHRGPPGGPPIRV
jgi:Trk K+ transport system NAD-binding subunit